MQLVLIGKSIIYCAIVDDIYDIGM